MMKKIRFSMNSGVSAFLASICLFAILQGTAMSQQAVVAPSPGAAGSPPAQPDSRPNAPKGASAPAFAPDQVREATTAPPAPDSPAAIQTQTVTGPDTPAGPSSGPASIGFTPEPPPVGGARSPRANFPGSTPRQTLLQAPSQAPPLSLERENGKRLYNLNFDDADIYSIIHTVFGDILRVNYVIDSRVKGRASFKSVARIPQENILSIMEVILRLNGVAVVEEEGLYRILPIGEIAREPSPVRYGREAKGLTANGKAVLQVIPINNVQSTEMVRLISPFLSVNASVVDVPKINGIVIVDTDANVKRVLRLIDIFDGELQKRKGPQVFVYPVQHSKAKDVAALLQQIFLGSKTGEKPAKSPPSHARTGSTPAGPGASGPALPGSGPSQYTPAPQPQVSMSLGGESVVSDIVRIMHDDIINSVVILGTPEDYAIIQETIKKIDIIPRQVLIEGTIAELNMTDKMSLGLRWAITGNIFGTNTGISLNPGNTSGSTGLNIIGTDSGGNIQYLINALATESKAKLLASPHIMVSDNREARIQVGQSVPIPTSETYGTPGVAPQRTIQYKDIGVILKVKPQISDSGQVTLDLSQEVSTFSTIPLYSNETQIILNKTDAATSLVVQDGQTIIIGGLIRSDINNAIVGIPWLSKIPLIGWLFGNTSRDDMRKELVILLTPRVVKSKDKVNSLTSEYVDKFTANGEKRGIQRHELVRPGNRPTATASE